MPFGWGKKQPHATEIDLRALDALAQALPPDPESGGPAPAWTERDTRNLLGHDHPLFTTFIAERARASVGGGILRFLLPETRPSLVAWNRRDGWASDWPSAVPGIAFATDWMGRLFLLARKLEIRSGEPHTIILAPQTGECDVLDYSFAELLEAFAGDWRSLLEADRFDAWKASGGAIPSPGQCVVPKTPLFLGGSDAIEDLELMPLVVTVSLTGQLWEQVKDLPEGSSVSGLSIR